MFLCPVPTRLTFFTRTQNCAEKDHVQLQLRCRRFFQKLEGLLGLARVLVEYGLQPTSGLAMASYLLAMASNLIALNEG